MARLAYVAAAGLILWVVPAVAETTGDPAAGERHWQQCSACHQIGEEARHGVGPHLEDIFGRTAAGAEGFSYSPALQAAGNEGLVWTPATLSAYVADPRGYVPGTRMTYRGLRDEAGRADLLAWLGEAAGGAGGEAAETLAPEILGLVGDPAYGEYLSGDCTSCHRADATGGIPSIAGWPEETFVLAMHAFKTGARTHDVMQMMAGRLSDEEIASLAAFFATLDP